MRDKIQVNLCRIRPLQASEKEKKKGEDRQRKKAMGGEAQAANEAEN